MKIFDVLLSRLSLVKRYHYKWMINFALAWTVIDAFYWLKYKNLGTKVEETYHSIAPSAILLRSVIVLSCSALICYYLIFKIRNIYRNSPRLFYILLKITFFFLSLFFMNLIMHLAFALLIDHRTVLESIKYFFEHIASPLLFLEHTIGWTILFILSHLLLEINEKYSPGIFLQIMTGKYLQPKVEDRIVMFLDMQGSTAIAEQLDSKKYFMFIRDFIYFLSLALLEFDGGIYQYVGDEIVVSWRYSKKNTQKAIASLMYAKRLFEKNKYYFMKRYNALPEFKVGIHCGEVTIGEIGIIKKDLVLSGDTMNTTARIRDACNDFNHLHIASKEFTDRADIRLKIERLGEVELKGKANGVELYAIHI